MHNPVEDVKSVDLTGRIEAAIAAGIAKGQAESKGRIKRRRRRLGGAIAACVLLSATLLSIRVSPVFAAMVRDIPGLEKFVDLIDNSYDRGIRLAVDNDFLQPVGVSDEHDGVKFTVQGIIADEVRMVVFYEIHLPGKDQSVHFDNPRLTDISGKPLDANMGFAYPEESIKDIPSEGIQRGTVEVDVSHGHSLPEQVVLKLKLNRSNLPNSSEPPKRAVGGSDGTPAVGSSGVGGSDFTVKIPIDRAKFAGLRREYAIGRTIEVQGQSITVAKAVVTPLRVSLYLGYGSDNTKQIFGPGDIRLVDDKGTAWKNVSGNVTNGHPVYNFESPYFNEPNSLFVEGSWFRALDKHQLTVTVDTDKQKLLDAPDDKLVLDTIGQTDRYTKLQFSLHGVDAQDKMMYGMFEESFTDAAGHTYTASSLHEVSMTNSANGIDAGQQHSTFYIDKNKAYKQPLTFKLYEYPGYIRQPYKIQIKQVKTTSSSPMD